MTLPPLEDERDREASPLLRALNWHGSLKELLDAICQNLIRIPWKVFEAFKNLFNFQSTPVRPRLTGRGDGFGHNPEYNSFNDQYEALYGEEGAHPIFFDDNLRNCIRSSRRDGNLVLVYLHDPESPLTYEFCDVFLRKDEVRSLIDDNFYFFPIDISVSLNLEVWETLDTLQVSQGPALVICVSQPNGHLRKGFREIQGFDCVNHSKLIHFLEKGIEQNANLQAARLEEVRESNAMRTLREEQDLEYQRMIAEHESEQKRQSPLQEMAEAMKNELNRRKILAQNLEAEPSTSPQTTCIGIRLPTGQRLKRNFARTALLTDVYAWCAAADVLHEDFSIPTQFRLDMPKTELNLQESLEGLGLIPNAVLFLKDLT